jgi:hypothetical protein
LFQLQEIVMPNFDKIEVKRVLLNQGECEFTLTKGEKLSAITLQGGRMLDDACVDNLVLIEGTDGQIYRGEFLFELTPISTEEAETILQDRREMDA